MIASNPNGAQSRWPEDFPEATQDPRSSEGTSARGPDDHPLEPLLAQLAVLREFALHYIEAQKDALRSSLRRTVIKAILGVGAGIVLATLVIVCTVIFALGLSQIVSILAGGHAWVGNVAVGGGVLLALALTITVIVARQTRSSRRHTIRKYESRHHAQRAKFGADVTQRAAL